MLLTALNNVGSVGVVARQHADDPRKKPSVGYNLRGINGQTKNGGNERDEGGNSN